jgi:hypothetical protein
MNDAAIVSDLARSGERLLLRRAQISDVPRVVALSRALSGTEPQRPDLDPATAWFTVGGPWMDAHYYERHLRNYLELGFDVWLVTTGADEVVGQIEVWYDDEPEPFGRYGHIELLELHPQFLVDEIEDWLIGQAEDRARSRGYGRFWCRPVGSGGSAPVLLKRGYERRWDNAQVTMWLPAKGDVPAYRLEALSGVYAREASGLLALNHREAAGYRWRYLWRTVTDPGAADMPRDTVLWASRVQFAANEGGVCLVSLWPWYAKPTESRVDFWVRPELALDAGHTRRLLAVAAEQARTMGAMSLISYLPKPLAAALNGDGIETTPLEDDDPWYTKEL